jgi:ATP-dependent Clp protease protease subunit
MPIEIKNISTEEKTATVYIYGEIVSEKFWDEDFSPHELIPLATMDLDMIDVYINSPGGAVFAGIAIYNMLKSHKALVRITVDGIAASIASVILQAGDERLIAANGMVMIHNPMGVEFGYASDLRKAADLLDKVKEPIVTTLIEKTKISQDDIERLMDEETYMTALEALDRGFVDKIVGDKVPVGIGHDGEIIFNSIKIDKKFKNIYKNSAKIEKYEPETVPVVIDYSSYDNKLVENNLINYQMEVHKNELGTNL